MSFPRSTFLSFPARLFLGLGAFAATTASAQTLASNTDYSGQNLSGGDYNRQAISNSNFTGANLSGANFELATLVNDNFTNATLFGANFWRTQFAGTIFAGADLRNTVFNATEFQNITNLIGANFSGTSLSGYVARGNFTGANLSNANLVSTNFTNANLTSADVSGADFTNASLFGANLSNSDAATAITIAQLQSTASARNGLILSGNNFSGVDFDGITLSSVIFNGTNFTSANGSGATFTSSNFSNANFTSANFSTANLSGTTFTDATVTGADFSYADLRNSNISGPQLAALGNATGVNFSFSDRRNLRADGARLIDANFSSANLQGAYLRNTVLTGANFSNADLTGALMSGNARDANFTSAKLNSGYFGGTDFRGANFTNANTTGAGLNQTDLRETNITAGQLGAAYKYLYQTNLSGLSLGNLSFTAGNADYANFSGTTLTSADFTGSSLWGANFTNANLTGANFTNAQVYYALFAGADLRNTWLTGAQLAYANPNLSGTNLANHTLSNADFSYFNFQGATLTNVQFNSSRLWTTDFTNTNLSGVNFTGAELYEAILTGANLSGAWFTGAQLVYVNQNVSGATLPNFNFSNLYLNGFNFASATLTGVSFASSTLSSVSFAHANLSGVNFSNAQFNNNDFTGANLTNANFTGTTLNGIHLLTHQLSGINFTNTRFYDVTLGDAALADGFVYSGQLDLGGGSSLTLASAGRAKIGSLTTLSSNARLSAAHGIELAAGRTLRGTGTIDTPNNSTDAAVLDGTVQSSGLKFTGYVRGDASYTGAVTFSGTLELSSTANNFAGTSGQITLDGGKLLATGNTSIARPILLASTSGDTISVADDATLTLSGRIDGVTLQIQGPGTVALTGENYFNRLILASGTLRVGSASNLNYAWDGTSTVTFNGGTLQASESFSATRTTILGAGGGKFDVGSDLTLGWNGAISGAGSLTKIGTGVIVLAGSNSYSGATHVNQGTLRLGSAAALSPHTTLHVASGAAFDANGFQQTVTGLTGTGSVHTGSAGLTVQTSSSDTPTTFNGTLAGTGGITVSGTGSLTIASNENTYTGETTVSGGRLKITGDISSSSLTAVSGTGILSGTGTVGVLSLGSGGTLAPGASPGTLHSGNTTWGETGNYEWEINDAAGAFGTNWDFLNVTGSLTIAATAENPFTISLLTLTAGNDSGPLFNFNSGQNSAYRIATASGGIFGFNPSLFTLDLAGFNNSLDGGIWSIAQNGNDLNLVFTSAIPEPSTYAFMVGALALAFVTLRRRRQRR